MARRLFAPARAPAPPVARPRRRRRLRRDRAARLARRSTGRAHLQQVEIDGTPDQLRGHRLARRLHEPVVLRPRPRRPVAELAREHPAAGARSGAWSRSTCPGFGLSPMPRDERSRSRGYGARGRTRSASELGARQGRARRQLDGRLHRGRGGDPVPGAGRRGSCSCRPPGSRAPTCSSAPILTLGRVAAAIAANTAARHRAAGARGRSRAHLLARAGGAPPAAAEAGPRLRGLHQGRRQARLRRRAARLPRLRLPRPAARDRRCPTLIVWGEKDSIIPVRDADEFERLIPDSRKVVMKDTGHVPMAERPAGVQRRAGGLPRRDGRGRGRSEAADGESQAA